MGFPQARLADLHACSVPIPPSPFPILPPCAVTVLVGSMPAARMTDLCAGIVPPGHPIAKGSMTVMICSLPAARVLDMCALGGPISVGLPTVLTGG